MGTAAVDVAVAACCVLNADVDVAALLGNIVVGPLKFEGSPVAVGSIRFRKPDVVVSVGTSGAVAGLASITFLES